MTSSSDRSKGLLSSSSQLSLNSSTISSPASTIVTTATTSPTAIKSTSIVHLAAGGLSGLSSSIILQPLDLLKTRVQQSSSTSLRGAIREITSLSQLWRGTLPSAIRTSSGSALYFTTLNATRVYLAKNGLGVTETFQNSRMSNEISPNLKPPTANALSSSSLPKLSSTANLFAGSVVRTVVGTFTMPITVVKVRYESSLYKYTSLYQAFTQILKTEGPKSFFSGTLATAARDAPYAGLYVVFYEHCKTVIPQLLEPATGPGSDAKYLNTSFSAIVNTISAMTSAGLATTITSPFDIIKTRLQLEPKRFTGFVQCCKLIVKDDGVKGLFNGLSLRMVRKAGSAAIAWCIYEEIIRKMDTQ
ncbi:mitochondrial carrier [Nadsonia fulvescens var. elongata DSM 6958]|uniref:Mitochondrial glycine transporter n=1 Tax=Nadsonia fulvescens var. elongata DSM 6958 TaxID=857566 RepID=A0A1E3PEG4_9ASCO|nr:mitochondrial carrier [Nadsonia fulvescens var. elongata DSM 6958]